MQDNKNLNMVIKLTKIYNPDKIKQIKTFIKTLI